MNSVALLCLAVLCLFVTVAIAGEHDVPSAEDSQWGEATAEGGYDSYNTAKRVDSYDNSWKDQIMMASAGSHNSVYMTMFLAFVVMVIALRW